MKKLLLVATVQSHICQFHKALVQMLRETEPDAVIHVAARNNLAEKNGLKLDFVDKVFDIPFDRSPFSRRNIPAYRALKKLINEGAYDIIHCNTPVGGILTRMAAKRVRRIGTRVVYTAHGFHFYQGAPTKNWLIYYPIEKIFARCTDVLITINEEDYRLASSRFRCRVEHIHGVGVDETRYHPVDSVQKELIRQRLELDGKVILCVGELLPNKNQSMLIRAMADVVREVPDARLLIAGNGSEKKNLEALADDLSLKDNVILLGYTLNLEEYQRVADVSVSCSRREGLGLNLIEAMLSETPVVATENRGHKELIQNGVNGYLIHQDDSHSLAQALITLLKDKKKSAAFAANGLEIGMKYSFHAVKKELKDIYYG